MNKHFRDYFIPHEGNSYAPHGLQKAAIFGMSILVILSFAIINLQSLIWISSDWLVSTILPAVIVDLTNEERETASLSDLRRNSILDVAATLKAQHMAQNEYFAHYSPDGVSPWHWFGVANYNFVHAGENLAIHFTDSGDVVEAWMDSPAHRANIMNGNYSEIGVGTAEGTYEGFKTVYVVQLFGTPAARAAATEPAPAPAVEVPPTPAVAAETVTEVEPEEETEVLAEAVEITETVEVIEPEPEAIIVPEVVTTTEETEATVTDMQITETGVALYSDHLATTTGGIPASIEADTDNPASKTSYLAGLATKPHTVLQMLYTLVALFVLGSLLMSILIEIRHQEPLQVAYSMALLLLMFGLYQVHVLTTGGALVV